MITPTYNVIIAMLNQAAKCLISHFTKMNNFLVIYNNIIIIIIIRAKLDYNVCCVGE